MQIGGTLRMHLPKHLHAIKTITRDLGARLFDCGSRPCETSRVLNMECECSAVLFDVVVAVVLESPFFASSSFPVRPTLRIR